MRRRRPPQRGESLASSASTPVSKLEVKAGQGSLAPRTVYEFKAIRSKRNVYHELDVAVTKLTVLLSRASGRDKLASFAQYAALFYGTNPLSGYYIRRGAAGEKMGWELVEDSMSSGRKVLRLLKWVLELQRCRASFKVQKPILRYLAVMMHAFSSVYYFVDNLIWSSNVGLINRAPHDNMSRRLLAKPGGTMSFDDFQFFQERRRKILTVRAARDARVAQWKDLKNWSSLGRLLLAIIYGYLRMRDINSERAALLSTAASKEEERSQMAKKMDALRNDETTVKRDLGFAVANLGILLQRLSILPLPMWANGVFGMVAGAIGIAKTPF